MSLQERLRAYAIGRRWDGHTFISREEATQAAAELDRLQARVAELGDLLCELMEDPAAGPFTNTMDYSLLIKWQVATDAAIDTARKAKP